MKSTEEILARCIDKIKTDKSSISECLERYPDMRSELEPLLFISENIRFQNIKPSADFKLRAKASLVEHIKASQQQKEPAALFEQLFRQHFWHTSWKKAFATAAAVMLMLAVAGTTTTYAARSSLPGETLYSVKLGAEQLQRIFTFSDAAEAELDLRLAEIRLDEMEKMIGKAEGANIAQAENIATAAAGYEKNIKRAIEKSNQTDNEAELLEKISLSIITHLEKLGELGNTVSKDVQQVVSQTKSSAIASHIDALNNLSLINPEKAMEINHAAIQKGLERAEKEASKGNSNASREAMDEVEKLRQFGNSLPSKPHGSNTGQENRNNTKEEKQKTSEQNNKQVPLVNNGHGLSDASGQENKATSHNQQSQETATSSDLPGLPLEVTPGTSGDVEKPEDSYSQSFACITLQPGYDTGGNSPSYDPTDVDPPQPDIDPPR